MPWERRPVEGNDHEADLRTGDQQRGIVKPQPSAILPLCDVNDGKSPNQPPAG
jgi:hypothetical protein